MDRHEDEYQSESEEEQVNIDEITDEIPEDFEENKHNYYKKNIH